MLKREDGRNMGRNYLDGKIRPPVGLSHVVRARHRPVSVARSILALVQVWGLPYRFSRLEPNLLPIRSLSGFPEEPAGRFWGFRSGVTLPTRHRTNAPHGPAPHRTSAREVLNHLQ